jgi:hypothetical protein
MNGNKRNGYDVLLCALHGDAPAVPYDEVDWPALQKRIMQRAAIWFDVRATALDNPIARARKSELTTSRR